MSEDLHILVCSYLEHEIRAACVDEGLNNILVHSFCGDCDNTGNEADICESLPHDHQEHIANIKVLGGACLRIQSAKAPLPKDWLVYPESSCFEILLGPNTTARYLKEGVHLLVPGMVKKWRTSAKDWGFDEKAAHDFFGESGSRLILLDTNTGGSCEKDLREFSEFTGLPFEVVPITLDYTRLFLRNLFNSLQLEKSNHAKIKAHRRIADMTLAYHLIQNLTNALKEKEIIDCAIELFSIVCAPKSVHYQSYMDNGKEEGFSCYNGVNMSAEMRETLKNNPPPVTTIKACNGIIIPVKHLDQFEGVFTLEGFAFPERIDDYLELIATATPILSLAVFNARTYERLSQIEPDLIRYQNELKTMVDERTFALTQEIVERKKIEKALVFAKEDAEKANQAKSEFLAAMSHDLRTPLNAIMGFSEMMSEKVFGPMGNDHYEQYANDIHNSGTLLVNLINDILDLSKIEAGKYELSEEPVDMSSMVQDSVHQFKQMAHASNHSLSAVIDSDMPTLRGDKRAVIQILNNLLSNAVKYTPDGGMITVTSLVDEQNRIVVHIEDTGIGMSKIGIVKALKPFEQADSRHSRNHEGTGLGLHICASLMKVFGGTMGIKSKIDVGTTVTLRFPPERTIFPS